MPNQFKVTPFGKELLSCLTVFPLCAVSICDCGYFTFWYRGQEFDSDCTGSWSLLTFFILGYHTGPEVIKRFFLFNSAEHEI